MTEPHEEEPVSKKTRVNGREDAVRVVRVEELEAAFHGAVENAVKDNCGKQQVACLSGGYSPGTATAVGPPYSLIGYVVKHIYTCLNS